MRGRIAGVMLGTLLVAAGCQRASPPVPPRVDLGQPSSYPTFEAYAGAPVLSGNSVEILQNGEQIFPAMLEAIRTARTSIAYAQYFYEDGPVAERLAAALADRCRAGVPGNVLLDGVGTLSMPHELVELMQRAGCHVAVFRPVRPWTVRRANDRNHRRILVVDGSVGFTGGSGVSAKWMGNGRTAGHWRDTDVRISGPAVTWLQAAFAENWLEATGAALGGAAWFPRMPRPAGGVAVQVVKTSPKGGAAAIQSTLLVAFASAQRTIHITNPYLLLDDALADTLSAAARRGVRVDVLVPGTIDHRFVREASRATWGRFLRAGVRVHEYEPALLHAKTIVIDGVWSTVGSSNLDHRSFAMNDELNVFFHDRTVAERLDGAFADDLARSREIGYEAWQHRGLRARAFELFVAPIRDLL